MPWRRTTSLTVPPAPGRVPLRHLVPAVGVVVGLLTAAGVSVAGHPPSGGGAAAPRTAAPAGLRGATTTAPDPALAPLHASTAAPLRVLEIGDSLGIDLGDQLQSRLDATAMVRTTMASVGDSGLSNVAFYDWPAHLATLLATDRPQVVVVFIGANDDQGLDVDGAAVEPGTPAWDAAYARRVDEVLGESTSAGARVVWVGMPPMADPDLNAAMENEDVIDQRETGRFAGTSYVSSRSVLGNASGLYETSGVDPSGAPVALRTPDGVHLTPAGAGLLAGIVIDAVDSRFDLILGAPPASG
ncbi:MAG TPA: DUF459 domain-containing protein [Acidimicrobiales bacterium]|nr:DUF459 domain-containing protein [Acidimicrobiales bacterium]